VVCTDVRMPGRADGIDVAVRARGRMPRVPVLVVSGYAAELGRRLDVLAPPSAFLSKPFTSPGIPDIAQVARSLTKLRPILATSGPGVDCGAHDSNCAVPDR